MLEASLITVEYRNYGILLYLSKNQGFKTPQEFMEFHSLQNMVPDISKLVKEGFIEVNNDGFYMKITEEGRNLLKQYPLEYTIADLLVD